jgi:hypothetical protein
VPGGGISLDGRRWRSSRPAFLLSVRVLGALFRRPFLTRLIRLHGAGQIAFFGTQAGFADHCPFPRHLAGVKKKRWGVPQIIGPAALLAYLSRYTHWIAISNRRLIDHTQPEHLTAQSAWSSGLTTLPLAQQRVCLPLAFGICSCL